MLMVERVTIRDLAKKAGLSVTTVSQILNHKGERFSADTRDKVLKLQKDLGYFPDYRAQELAGIRTNTIGIVVPDIKNTFYTDFISAIEKTAIPQGIYPQIFNVGYYKEDIDYLIKNFASGSQNGLILAAPGVSNVIIEKVINIESIPVVTLDRANINLNFVHRISVNNLEGGRLAVTHLLNLGHQKIAFILPKNIPANIEERIEGYKLAFRNFKIKSDDELTFRAELSKEGGYEIAKQIVKTDATAIVTVNDDTAIGIYRGLAELGKSVPDDYSIIGFDDIEFAEYLNPKLTTIRQPISEMGKLAVELIINDMNNHLSSASNEQLPVKLVERESTRRNE